MKPIFILAFLGLYLAVSARDLSKDHELKCPGYVFNSTCTGSKNIGHDKWSSCQLDANNDMWYYSQISQTCWKMVYFGCGGNSNRHCTQADCMSACGKKN
ncbi:hypothetical protein KR222_010098 [Zaprionus bogoriensis]|nr:hypothetical protein KR222_010098 [Zaprionus bogoriensis]